MNIETFIIIVTYNSEDFILNCINSILASDYKKWFLTVIDNNSTDSTIEKIRRFRKSNPSLNYANFELITLTRNTGFSGAVNYSVFKFLFKKDNKYRDVIRYLVLINPDCIIEESTLSNLIDAFNMDDNHTGAAGGIIYDYDKTGIQNAGGVVQDNFLTSHLTGISSKKDPYPVDYVTGALFITKMDLFKSIGGLDTGYRPVYFEELDYCMKVKRMGKKVIITKKAVARHFECASVEKFSPRFFKYYHKNRIRCICLNAGFNAIFKNIIPSELKWLKNNFSREQTSAILSSYFLNFLFLPYNLAIRLKNVFKMKNIKSGNSSFT